MINNNINIENKGARIKVHNGDDAPISYGKFNVFTFDFLTPNVFHFIVLDLNQHEYRIPLENLLIDGVNPATQQEAQELLDKMFYE